MCAEVIKDWIVKPLRDQHVKPKSKATFKCELFKDTPNWKWLKGDTQLAPSDKVEINKDGNDVTLTINNCQPDDVADYTFEVEDRKYSAKLTLGGLCVSVVKNLWWLLGKSQSVTRARLSLGSRAGGRDPEAAVQPGGGGEGGGRVPD